VRRVLAWIAVVVTALLLQTTIFAQIELGGSKPQLIFLVTIVMAVLEGPSSGAIAGFSGGMAQDFFLQQPAGITALTLTLVGYMVGTIRHYITTPSPALPTLLVGAGTAGGVIFYGFVSFLLGEPLGVLEVLQVAFLSAVYNALLTPLLFPLLRRVAELSRRKKVYRW
jgi:rod shape-determining protein MreD